MIAYSAWHFILQNTSSIQNVMHHEETIVPLWSFELSLLLSNFRALVYGFVSSLIVSTLLPKKKQRTFVQNIRFHFICFENILTSIILVFVLRFALKMQNDQILFTIFRSYSIIFVIIMSATYLYIFFLYGAANLFKITSWIASISNMVPAFITAMSTMSSSIAMPLTLEGSKKKMQSNLI
ncbi:MAG: cation:dicarboxylate symporter family transporter [Wolbachia sp.]